MADIAIAQMENEGATPAWWKSKQGKRHKQLMKVVREIQAILVKAEINQN